MEPRQLLPRRHSKTRVDGDGEPTWAECHTPLLPRVASVARQDGAPHKAKPAPHCPTRALYKPVPYLETYPGGRWASAQVTRPGSHSKLGQGPARSPGSAFLCPRLSLCPAGSAQHHASSVSGEPPRALGPPELAGLLGPARWWDSRHRTSTQPTLPSRKGLPGREDARLQVWALCASVSPALRPLKAARRGPSLALPTALADPKQSPVLFHPRPIQHSPRRLPWEGAHSRPWHSCLNHTPGKSRPECYWAPSARGIWPLQP